MSRRRHAMLAPLLAVAACAQPQPPAEVVHAGSHETPHAEPRRVPVELPEQYALPERTTTTRPSRSRTTTVTARPRDNRPLAVPEDVWAALARCESSMRQDAVGEGVHYSYFQWKLATWRSVKAPTDPDDPRDAPYEAQVAAAQRLQARSGWGQWPHCSRKLGLR